MALTKAVPSEPFVSAETLKACALIGLHLFAAEGEAGSSGSQFLDVGDMRRYSCPTGTATLSRAVRTQRGKPCSECYGARPVR